MPKPQQKRGLIENAGAGLACPHCRSERVWVTTVVIGMPDLGVMIDATRGSSLTTIHKGEGMTIEVVMACERGHAFSVVLGTRGGDTRVVTEWEMPEQDDE